MFNCMKILAVLFACCFFVPSVFAEATDPQLPKGVSISDRKAGFLIVNGKEGVGVYSQSGAEIIPPKFGRIDYVGEQLFVTTRYRDDASQEVQLVSKSGRKVSDLPDWARTDMTQFHEGLLNIGEGVSAAIFIDMSGKIVLHCDKFQNVKDFSSGLAAATYIDRAGTWGCYINRQGKVALGPFERAECSTFENGQATVTEYLGSDKTLAAVIDTGGKFVLPLEFERIFVCGDKYLGRKAGRFYTYDRSGKLLGEFPKNCTDVVWQDWNSSIGWLACAFDGNGKIMERGKDGATWGYCDLSGKIQIAPRFVFCEPFYGERANVQVRSAEGDKLNGVIDVHGNWLVKPAVAELQLGKFEDATGQRSMIFSQILKDVNLIGMPRVEVRKLFGNDSVVRRTPHLPEGQNVRLATAYYSLTIGATCGNSARGLEIKYDDNDNVVGWRVSGGDRSIVAPWITENVIVDSPLKGFDLANLLPKNAEGK